MVIMKIKQLDGTFIEAPAFIGPKGDSFTYDDFTPEQLEKLKGNPGYSPIRGEDYWTDVDKEEIKSYINEAILRGEW